MYVEFQVRSNIYFTYLVGWGPHSNLHSHLSADMHRRTISTMAMMKGRLHEKLPVSLCKVRCDISLTYPLYHLHMHQPADMRRRTISTMAMRKYRLYEKSTVSLCRIISQKWHLFHLPGGLGPLLTPCHAPTFWHVAETGSQHFQEEGSPVGKINSLSMYKSEVYFISYTCWVRARINLMTCDEEQDQQKT